MKSIDANYFYVTGIQDFAKLHNAYQQVCKKKSEQDITVNDVGEIVYYQNRCGDALYHKNNKF